MPLSFPLLHPPWITCTTHQGWVGATLLSSPPSTMNHLYYPQDWVCFTLYPLLRPSWITFITPRARCVSPFILPPLHQASLVPYAEGWTHLRCHHPPSPPPPPPPLTPFVIIDRVYYSQGWHLSKLTLHLWLVYMHSLDSFSVLEFS